MSGYSLLETSVFHHSIISSSNYFSRMGVNLLPATLLAQILLFISNSKNCAEG